MWFVWHPRLGRPVFWKNKLNFNYITIHITQVYFLITNILNIYNVIIGNPLVNKNVKTVSVNEILIFYKFVIVHVQFHVLLNTY